MFKIIFGCFLFIVLIYGLYKMWSVILKTEKKENINDKINYIESINRMAKKVKSIKKSEYNKNQKIIDKFKKGN